VRRHVEHHATSIAVLAIDDYLPCAPVARWLGGWLEGRAVGVCRGTPTLAIPRGLRRWLAPLPDLDSARTGESSRLTALLHVAPIDRRIDASRVRTALQSIEIGAPVLDLAFARGLVTRPWRRSAVFDATAHRFEDWARLGIVALEQWVTDDGSGMVITAGTYVRATIDAAS